MISLDDGRRQRRHDTVNKSAMYREPSSKHGLEVLPRRRVSGIAQWIFKLRELGHIIGSTKPKMKCGAVIHGLETIVM